MKLISLLGAAMAMSAFATGCHGQWKPAASPLMTEWASKVDPKAPLPDYPRPQLVRETWTNLNGLWDYAITPANAPEAPAKYDGQILVPFAIESALSGVGKKVGAENALWYRRTFASQKVKPSERTLLHFGGVDWQTMVYLNGRLVGEHSGGHTPFTVDLTTALVPSGENELVVRVWDPTDAGSQPRGKQIREPNGIWYTSVTGIWQTVWTDTVPATSIDKLKITPDVDGGNVLIEAVVTGGHSGSDVEVIASDGTRQIATATGKSDAPIKLAIANAKLWSPDSPFLYDLTVNLKKDGKTVDTVKSYFAMRKVSTAKDSGGYLRLTLNNKPIFMFGPLDQGWWPDGLYTAPTDEALKWDIEFTKKLGFNMARKHIKIEPARWYYYCDKLGLMVWQDQSSGMEEGREQGIGPGSTKDAIFTPIEKVQFMRELREMMDTLHNSPSIVCWVPFNEGWGQHDTNDVLKWVKAYDPSRLVDGPTGWEDRGYGDMHDMHNYPGPNMFPVQDDRVSVLGEFGGLGLPVEAHLWQPDKNWGYRTFKGEQELGDQYERLTVRLGALASRGLGAAVYTQTTDVEGEVNGFTTYDRKHPKYDIDKMSNLNKKVIEAALTPKKARELVPTSERDGQTYQYTFEKPADGWEKPGFDASAWKSGPGPLGHTRGDTRIKPRSEWTTPDVWARRTIKLEAQPAEGVYVRVQHDDDFELYINGVLAAGSTGAAHDYNTFHLTGDALKALKVGDNIIAVHCKDGGGDSVIDFGIGEDVPVK